MTQPPRRRGRSRLPLAVAVALPTIMVTPPDFGDPAGARSAVLTVSDVTHASATLTITGHQSDWYYKDTRPSGAACSPVAAGTSTAELTGLTPETSYTYQAYSDRDCAAVLATAPAFTTPAAPAVILSTTDLTVTEGSAGAYTVALAAPPSGPVAVTIAAAEDPDITISAADCDARTAGIQLCFTTDDYDTAQTVTVAATEDDDGADGATLNLVGHAGAWWYQGDQAGAACTQVAEGTAFAQVGGLVSGASYMFTAYSDPACENAVASATFTTYGIVLTPGALIITEGNTDTYTIALTALPTDSVKVTIAKTGAANLTFSADDCDTVTSGTQLCFTTTNYSTAQTVTVTAAQDTNTAGGSAVLTHTTSGGGHTNVSATLTATPGLLGGNRHPHPWWLHRRLASQTHQPNRRNLLPTDIRRHRHPHPPRSRHLLHLQGLLRQHLHHPLGNGVGLHHPRRHSHAHDGVGHRRLHRHLHRQSWPPNPPATSKSPSPRPATPTSPSPPPTATPPPRPPTSASPPPPTTPPKPSPSQPPRTATIATEPPPSPTPPPAPTTTTSPPPSPPQKTTTNPSSPPPTSPTTPPHSRSRTTPPTGTTNWSCPAFVDSS